MSYRTVEIAWLPHTAEQWRIFTSSRMEASRLWNDMTLRHQRIRRLHWKWPSKKRWLQWAQRKYPHLAAQSVQQVVYEFLEALEAISRLRKRGHADAHYPWRLGRYRDVPYCNQGARIKDLPVKSFGVVTLQPHMVLPHGKEAPLHILLPRGFRPPGRVMEVRLAFGRLLMVCKLPEAAEQVPGPPIGVDLGVNTLIAATDGTRALLVSGRGVKATVQWRNKRLASLVQAQSRRVRGSRRWKRLQRRKRQMLTKAHRRVRDSIHKATHQVAMLFPDSPVVVGEPFNDASQKVGRRTAQTVSQAANRVVINQLAYKLGTAGVQTIEEHYTSQTCPVCGVRSKHRRIFRCVCGVEAPRDVIGATNILMRGTTGALTPVAALPSQVTYRRPDRRSSGGHPASSSTCAPGAIRREAKIFWARGTGTRNSVKRWAAAAAAVVS
jgi:putative transposase